MSPIIESLLKEDRRVKIHPDGLLLVVDTSKSSSTDQGHSFAMGCDSFPEDAENPFDFVTARIRLGIIPSAVL